MKEIKVYIASPYTNGWMPKMIRTQLDAADELIDLGFCPFVPLLAHFQEIYNPRTEEDWLRVDFAFVKVCDALLRIRLYNEDGSEIYSSGADRECEVAKENGIPIFESIKDLYRHFYMES
jgi:nucleoside 2-deoxyribosyltransferase